MKNPVLHTLGYEGVALVSFIARLEKAGDGRTSMISMGQIVDSQVSRFVRFYRRSVLRGAIVPRWPIPFCSHSDTKASRCGSSSAA